MELSQALEQAVANLFSSRKPLDVEQMARVLATVDSARFFTEEMPLATNYVKKGALLDAALSAISVEGGMALEFGVFRGTSLRHIAETLSGQDVYGFDSFEGLPEDWTHFQKKGRFSLGGQLPQGLPANAKLVKGWFDESLPGFLKEHSGPVAFLHIDSDIYSSARTVLTELTPRIVPGTVILFDEYFNYPGWQQHEHKAFCEFIDETGHAFEYLGFASAHFSLAVRILQK